MRAFILSAAVVAADIFTKWLIQQQMAVGESIPVIPGFFHLTFTMNPGAAFGILPGQRYFFIGVSILAAGLMAYYITRPEGRQGLIHYGLGLMLGGAVGNLIDRIRYGRVVDYLEFFWRDYYFPAFNVADSAITIGTGLLILFLLWQPQQEVEGG